MGLGYLGDFALGGVGDEFSWFLRRDCWMSRLGWMCRALMDGAVVMGVRFFAMGVTGCSVRRRPPMAVSAPGATAPMPSH